MNRFTEVYADINGGSKVTKTPMGYIPMVIEKTGRGDRAFDIYSLMVKERIIFITGLIDDEVASSVVAQFLYLEADNPNKDISLYINSPGGQVYAGFAIHDVIRFVRPEVRTLCVGMAASMGAFLLASGTKGKRYSLPNSRIMLHQPSGGTFGQASDIQIQAQEISWVKDNINKILSEYTGRNIEDIKVDTDRDRFLSPDQALEYGVIDKIVREKENIMKG